MTEALLTSTAPVFEVEEQVKGELARDLLRLEVAETTAGLKTLKARFTAVGPIPGATDEGQLYLDGAILDFGKKLDVSIGPGPEARTIFEGYISGLEANARAGQPHTRTPGARRPRAPAHEGQGERLRRIAARHC